MSLDSIRRVLLEEADAIVKLAGRLDGSFQQAVTQILECRGRVITCGLGKSGHIARKTAGTLSSTGTPSLFLHAAEAAHGDLGMVTAPDVVMMYTYSGESDELMRLFPSIESIGASTIVLTGRPKSSVANRSNLVLDCSADSEACPNNLAPTTSTTLMLALSDALAIAVMELRGFAPTDFARFHPSGALGKRLLLKVSDVMRTGADLAAVSPSEQMLGVMRSITEAGAGAAMVVDSDQRLMGIITEGDVRRHLLSAEQPLIATAAELLKSDPVVIGPELLAIEALEVFQNLERKIGEMPVVEGGRLVGILMLKDLVRSGIV